MRACFVPATAVWLLALCYGPAAAARGPKGVHRCVGQLSYADKEVRVGDVVDHMVDKLGLRVVTDGMDNWNETDTGVVAALKRLFEPRLAFHVLWKNARFNVSIAKDDAAALKFSAEPWRSHAALCAALGMLNTVLDPLGAGGIHERLCACVEMSPEDKSYGQRCGVHPWKDPWAVLMGVEKECEQSRAYLHCQIRTGLTPGTCLHAPPGAKVRIDTEEAPKILLGDFVSENSSLSGVLPLRVPHPAARLVVGGFLLLGARPLSNSRAFHYALAAALGVAVAALIAVVVLTRYGTMKIETLPYGRAFTRSVAVLVAAGSVYVNTVVVPIFSAFFALMLQFWKSGLFGYTWVGKAYFVAFSVVAVMMVHFNGWGAMYSESDLELIEEMNEFQAPQSNGTYGLSKPTEILVDSNGQVSAVHRPGKLRDLLREGLRFVAVLLIASSLGDVEVGIAVALLILFWSDICYVLFRLFLLVNAWTRPSHFAARPNMTDEEFEQEKAEVTKRELERLRIYLKSARGKRDISKVENEGTVMRLERFVKTGHHVRDDRDTAARDDIGFLDKIYARCVVS